MINVKKKIIAIIAVISMISMILTACSGSGSTEQNQNAANSIINEQGEANSNNEENKKVSLVCYLLMQISARHFADAFRSFCSSQVHQNFFQDACSNISYLQAAADTIDDTTLAGFHPCRQLLQLH